MDCNIPEFITCFATQPLGIVLSIFRLMRMSLRKLVSKNLKFVSALIYLHLPLILKVKIAINFNF